jgi:hypothetical protein
LAVFPNQGGAAVRILPSLKKEDWYTKLKTHLIKIQFSELRSECVP